MLASVHVVCVVVIIPSPSALVALCERKSCWIMLLLLLRYPFLSTVNFYVHCPEWYSGTPKDDLAPRHWFSARRWFAESPQSVAPRYTCWVSLAPPPQIVNCFSPSREQCWRAYMLSVLSLSFPLPLRSWRCASANVVGLCSYLAWRLERSLRVRYRCWDILPVALSTVTCQLSIVNSPLPLRSWRCASANVVGLCCLGCWT